MDIENKTYQPNSSTSTPPLRLSPQAIREFQDLYFKEFQIEISVREADRLGMNLLKLFSAVYKPIRRNDYANK